MSQQYLFNLVQMVYMSVAKAIGSNVEPRHCTMTSSPRLLELEDLPVNEDLLFGYNHSWQVVLVQDVPPKI